MAEGVVPGLDRRAYAGPWRADVSVRADVALPLARAVLVRAIVAALEAAGAPRPASIGLILSDDRELASLNAEHMGASGSTDVLSFPLLPPEAFPPHPGQPRTAPTRPLARFILPPGRRPHLGDVVVSVEWAVSQARAGRGGQAGDVRWSAADELRLLVTHGTLHICGWNHANAAEEAAMRALEHRLLLANQ